MYQVATLTHSGENLLRDVETEKAKLPHFALAFYKFLFFKGQLPTEQALWKQYLNAHFWVLDETRIQFFRKGTWRVYDADALKVRLLRSFKKTFRVTVILNSERARQFKEQKYRRYAETTDQEVIVLFDLPRSEQNKGKIKLFSPQHIQ